MNEELCNAIRAAFAGVKLGSGIGLREADGLDDYADDETRARYRESDEKEDWSRIPVDRLNDCFCSLSFFDAESMRFHLPAYLIAYLQDEYRFDVELSVIHLTDYKIRQFALFTDAQRAAVRSFLLHLADHPDYAFEHPDILRALNEYWIARSDRRPALNPD